MSFDGLSGRPGTGPLRKDHPILPLPPVCESAAMVHTVRGKANATPVFRVQG